MDRRTRFIIAAALLAAFIGYTHWRDQQRAQKQAAPTAASAADSRPTADPSVGAAGNTPVAITRTYGRLQFSPCTLAPEMGTQTVEAQCTTMSVRSKPQMSSPIQSSSSLAR